MLVPFFVSSPPPEGFNILQWFLYQKLQMDELRKWFSIFSSYLVLKFSWVSQSQTISSQYVFESNSGCSLYVFCNIISTLVQIPAETWLSDLDSAFWASTSESLWLQDCHPSLQGSCHSAQEGVSHQDLSGEFWPCYQAPQYFQREWFPPLQTFHSHLSSGGLGYQTLSKTSAQLFYPAAIGPRFSLCF